jgi:MoaA/NifB/PqqE/SkfB family radical SAM enzyme/2-polyprenyl-3-methyl-5-hydroxy-6-metoxy-1,4-benzoquinol methylase
LVAATKKKRACYIEPLNNREPPMKRDRARQAIIGGQTGAKHMWKLDTGGLFAFANRSLHLIDFSYVVTKPLLLLKAVQYVSRYLITKENLPYEALLSINSSCNLNCRHCFARVFKTQPESKLDHEELTTEELVAAIKEYIDMGIFAFSFQGGEVLLRPDLEQVIKACEPHRSYVTVITNGVLFDEEWARKLKSWGVDLIAVSIDSLDAEEHDQFRNRKGVFEKATNAARIAKRNGLSVIVFTTVTHQNLHSEGIKKTHEYCMENGFLQQLFIGIPIGKWANQTDILVDADDHAYMDRLARKSGHKIRRDLTPHQGRSGCPAVKEGFYMTSYGDILPCPFIHISIGNIRDYSIKDILNRALTIDELREYNPDCLIGEDKHFIEKYGKLTYVATHSPLDGEKVFAYKELPKRTVALAGDGSSTKRYQEVFLEANRGNPDLEKDFKLHYHSVCVGCDTPTPTHPIACVREHEYQNTTSLQFPIYQCPQCRLVYLNPRPDVSELKSIYPPDYYSYQLSMKETLNGGKRSFVQSLYFKMGLNTRKPRILPYLKQPPGRPLRVLDIGCGTGVELDNLKPIFMPGTETYGVEIDQNALRKAEKNGHKGFLGRFEEVELPENYFDLIMSFHVIEHVERPDLFLQKVIKLLTPDGIALIETPNTDGLDYQLLKDRHWGGYHAPRHWQIFNIDTFKHMAKQAEANIVAHGSYHSSVFWNWSCHSLSVDLMPRKIADKLFPPVKIFYGGAQAFAILGFFSIVERTLTKLFGRSNCMWVVFNKKKQPVAQGRGLCALPVRDRPRASQFAAE